MKRWFVWILAFVLVFSLAACDLDIEDIGAVPEQPTTAPATPTEPSEPAPADSQPTLPPETEPSQPAMPEVGEDPGGFGTIF